MLPPLPAASRPSKMISTRWPVSFTHACSLSNSTCRRNFFFFVDRAAQQIGVRVAAVFPVLGQFLIGIGLILATIGLLSAFNKAFGLPGQSLQSRHAAPWHALCLSRLEQHAHHRCHTALLGGLGGFGFSDKFFNRPHPPPLRYRPPGLCACRGRHVGRSFGYCWGWAYQPCAKTPCRTAPQPLWRVWVQANKTNQIHKDTIAAAGR